MKRLAPALLALTISCSGAGQPTTTTTTTAPATTPTIANRLLTDDEWREDLQFLAARLGDVHPNAWWRVGEKEFVAMVEEVDASIPLKADDEIFLDLTRLAATIDGHSQLFPLFQRTFDQSMLPVQLYLFEEGVYVVAAAPEYDDLIGSRVVEIGSVTADEAVQLVFPYLQYDNEQTRRLLAPLLLVAPDILATLGVQEPQYLTLLGPDGTETRRRIEAIPDDEFAPAIPGDFGLGLPEVGESLYLRNRDLAFWSTLVADTGTAWVQYNFVQRSSPTAEGTSISLEQMVERTDQMLEEQGAERIVIDLRHNPGGNNFTYAPLLEWVQERSIDYPTFVILGRNTFSAAMNFATEVEQTSDAVFVGEESGGRPNLYGDVRSVLLPNSRLTANISTAYWEKSTPDDDRDSIIPDLVIPVTAAAYFAGEDPALNAILAYDD